MFMYILSDLVSDVIGSKVNQHVSDLFIQICAHCNCIYNFQGRENLDGRTKESVEVDFQQKWSPSVVGAFSLDFPESIKVFVYTLWNLLFPVDQVFARK